MAALAAFVFSATAYAVGGPFTDDHAALLALVGSGILGLFAIGAGMRSWIVAPAIAARAAQSREEWHTLRDELIGMLHRIENAVGQARAETTQNGQKLDALSDSVAELWEEHKEMKGGAYCVASPRDPKRTSHKRRSDDGEGLDFTGVRGRS